MKSIIISILFAMLTANLFAQKQSFDIVSYTAPTDWTLKQGNDNVSYSRIDGASWAQIAIYQHRNCEGDIQTDFYKDWNELVAANKTISSPEKTEPKTAEGWTVMSGSGVWQYNGANVASVLTVYSNNKICVAVLCNATAQPYLKNYKDLISSLDLDATSVNNTNASTNIETQTNANTNTNHTSIVGLWTNYILETTGYNVGGMPQYTAGYLRKEYQFNADGSYTFRNKQWLTKAADITFLYETGTYTVSGNQLTITPASGKGGFWAKTNSSKEWGKLKKYTDYNLEKATYTFEIINDPTYGNGIILKSGKPTTRDGGKFNAPNDPYEFRYSFRKLESLIDNPPGFKLNEAASASENNILSNSANSILAGKTFEGTSLEKTGSGNMQFNTGGYWTWQYKFNKDGTYRFVYVAASHFNEAKLLQYETGTYSVNNDQLTIIPEKGANEEWSKIGKTSNGNSDAGNRAINDTWNKKLKTSSRKLEKVTYSFSIQYLDANKASTLILQHHNATERDGKPGWDDSNYYVESSSGKTGLSLPTGFQ